MVRDCAPIADDAVGQRAMKINLGTICRVTVATLAALLILVWVRSVWVYDEVAIKWADTSVSVSSYSGGIGIDYQHCPELRFGAFGASWRSDENSVLKSVLKWAKFESRPTEFEHAWHYLGAGFNIYYKAPDAHYPIHHCAVRVPYWFLLFVLALGVSLKAWFTKRRRDKQPQSALGANRKQSNKPTAGDGE